MANKLVELLELQVRLPLWLFIAGASSLGYDAINALGVLG
ncbi:hypothetical protein C171_00240 [Pseudomonas phage YMC11/06/C171_PPU_BP]|uniref:Uncharacterized protein n=1 Tax=Pseudomonas phage YMC11/06/C171_PPU_BP TaxID=1777063 RepID=A0A127KNY5_9CAUD|nr:hypothetical protein BH776_gp24 [Pseudomonas phage YMC11/06/C171_PPU_BP]AMO43648.1 hypothetical protein C171_00240 [Pseudomonas phage YMC11/06/C171_PPU_BP]